MQQAYEVGQLANTPARATSARPQVRGKFLFAGERKILLKGVTYGTFGPDEQGIEFPDFETVQRDFRLMAANGINAVRVYTVPPGWVLDAARKHGLYVMVGLPWEQHVAFLDDPGRARGIEQHVREAVRQCAGHPAILCFAIGNEIPASIVRWHGARRIERFLGRLYRAVKAEDPGALVTYVNFPTTEYLRLPFLDFHCFNVYLERREQLEAYLAELQNLAGERPLVMAEIGLDSRRHGEIRQGEVLEWQVRTIFEAGCVGAFVFAWTDQWHRGGYDIEDWDFGLTTRDRRAKPALASVRAAFAAAPFPKDAAWPRISVVVCTHNGERTLAECLEGLRHLEYPNYEVIVVDDGSTDGSARIAAQYPFRLIRTENRGLSAARNIGMEAASGEIVAYIDDDAYPDPHWLQYLARVFRDPAYAGAGGPNIAPPDDGPLAECVANSPGGPVHVLLSARDAEHIPGCNCAFRRECLLAVGGFDPQFWPAGDDVDLCWRLLERGWKLGFHAGAVVWHHRRGSLGNYWKQQKGYGKAEALLEKKWPSKYNGGGHVTWVGRLYGNGFTRPLARWRIYHGTWNSALFQRLYAREPGMLASIPLTPEWYLVIGALAILTAMQGLWAPLRCAAIPLGLAIGVSLVYVARTVAGASFSHKGRRWRILTMCLHIAQPLARLWGRINHGLTLWRHHGARDWANPRPRVMRLWSERWRPGEEWLRLVEQALEAERAVVSRGGDFARWDLEIRGCLLGGIRTCLAVEEHGAGRQLLRFHTWPVVTPGGIGLCAVFAGLAAAAWWDHAPVAGVMLGALALAPGLWALRMCGRAQAACLRAVGKIGAQACDA